MGLATALRQRADRKMLRSRQVREARYNFSGNDYLGLTNHPEIKRAFQRGIDAWGVGSTGSPLVSGYQAPHRALEALLAEWLNVEAVALFSTGFAANSALMSLLCQNGFFPYLDRLSHASLFHGLGTFSSSSKHEHKFKRFKHNDFSHLSQLIQRSSAPNAMVVTEGVFSMDGDSPCLNALQQVLTQDYSLWIDDAHALGWFGEHGAGLAAALNSREQLFVTGTFGKALGCHGAFVGGAKNWIDGIVNFAPEYIYSTAMPAAQACAVSAAIQVVQHEACWKLRLLDNIQYFKQEAIASGLPVSGLESPIQALEVNKLLELNLSEEEELRALMNLAKVLADNGFLCGAIRPPTVPKGTSRLRVSLSAAHGTDCIRELILTVMRWRERFLKHDIASSC
ncbi:MAG: 8-amino-7-oxononanoate synthase BioF [Idiomarinaceae bacterium HL-53]|nr:MAG: 8-amino-7-oxononanoate synthase BioF [Idiomarinaceae bacterium HL-53]CUS48959.1 8-amino-7-oxononanoate synthase [Idiomarinaceae bacterium HL-53]